MKKIILCFFGGAVSLIFLVIVLFVLTYGWAWE